MNPAQSSNFTYAYIDDWKRYYFITDIVFVSHTLVELHLKVDVLATYKTEIGASEQYVVRSYSDYDGNAVDQLYPALSQTAKSVDAFSGTTSFVRDIKDGFFVLGYVETMAGFVPATNYTGVIYVVLKPTEFQSLLFHLNASSVITDVLQYIVSVKWFPFAPTYSIIGGGTGDISLGDIVNYHPAEFRMIQNPIWSSSAFGVTIPKHPQASARGNFLNISPFSFYTLYNPLIGEHPIDGLALAGYNKLWFRIKCDGIKGDGVLTLFVVDGSAEKTLMTINCNLGVDVEIGLGRINVVQAGFNLAESVAAMSRGNFLGGVEDVFSSVENLLPKIQTTGVQGSYLPYDYEFYLRSEFVYVADEDRENRGRLLMKTRTINTLNGFIKCADADIALTATAEEQAKVKSYMESGFFYE